MSQEHQSPTLVFLNRPCPGQEDARDGQIFRAPIESALDPQLARELPARLVLGAA